MLHKGDYTHGHGRGEGGPGEVAGKRGGGRRGCYFIPACVLPRVTPGGPWKVCGGPCKGGEERAKKSKPR